jgi:probable selenate reductase FAD-binding subunit
MSWSNIERFYRPETISAAINLVQQSGDKGSLLAGGTDIAVKCDASVRSLIDLSRLPLNFLRQRKDYWAIGAMTRVTKLIESDALKSYGDGLLISAAQRFGSKQIRNMATVGGNLANASPVADLAPPLLVFDAWVLLASECGRRLLPLDEFFLAAHNSPRQREILLELRIPIRAGRKCCTWSFRKFGRTVCDIALVNAASAVSLGRDGRCEWARVAVGGIAPVPIRLKNVENRLRGEELTGKTIDRACELIGSEIEPISDLRGSADYRKEIASGMVREVLSECGSRAVPL